MNEDSTGQSGNASTNGRKARIVRGKYVSGLACDSCMSKTEYYSKLKDPRWQKKRLTIFGRDNFTCQICQGEDKELQCHHLVYLDGEPWDCPDDYLVTLCNLCHKRLSDKKDILKRLFAPRHYDVSKLMWILAAYKALCETNDPDRLAATVECCGNRVVESALNHLQAALGLWHLQEGK